MFKPSRFSPCRSFQLSRRYEDVSVRPCSQYPGKIWKRSFIAVISGLTSKQGERVNSALYWPFSLVCVPLWTKEYLTAGSTPITAIPTGWPTVHTNPSQKRSFYKTLFNESNLKTLGFRFTIERKRFQKWVFRKWWRHDNQVISLTQFFSKKIQNESCILKFLRGGVVCTGPEMLGEWQGAQRNKQCGIIYCRNVSNTFVINVRLAKSQVTDLLLQWSMICI